MIKFQSFTKYLSVLIAFLSLLSCSDDIPISPIEDSGKAVLDGENIILRGSVTLPESPDVSTRTIGDNPSLSDLHLYAVEFTDAKDPLVNTFIRVYEAEKEAVSGDQVNFSITLRSTTLPRILHLIALPKSQSLNVEKGIEGAVIPALTTQGGMDAYWRRLEFPDGYCVETAGTWDVDPQLRAKMTRVPLIRNYAKFTMVNNAEGFDLLGFTLVNTPSKGSIAAWNPSTRKFIDFLNGDNEPLEFSQVSGVYAGLNPQGTAIENQILPPEGSPIADNASEPQFMYERPFSETARTYIIVKGKRNGKIFYYKIDIGKNDDNGIFRYYNILRNFNYKVTLKTVSADGYDTVGEAAAGTVFNNISFDIIAVR